MEESIKRRYEFVCLFDVENGNPNGDPDAGNMPRLDPETSHGLITDVCLKRKLRNYVETVKNGSAGYRIYVQSKAVLNRRNEEAYINNPTIERPAEKKLPKKEEDANHITRWMCDNFFDVRAFGAVMTTEVNCGQVCGPVQLNFARSIEPIVPLEISITRMAVTNERDVEKERTMGHKYIVPYALYRVEGYI
jgi:CRISPR-associated protein Csd2